MTPLKINIFERFNERAVLTVIFETFKTIDFQILFSSKTVLIIKTCFCRRLTKHLKDLLKIKNIKQSTESRYFAQRKKWDVKNRDINKWEFS